MPGQPTEVLGVALLGCGLAGQAIHLPAIQSLSNQFELRVVMDPSVELAQATARRVGAEAVVDLGEAVERPGVDVVVVASPTQFHAEQVIAACQAGVRAVLCEKPLTADVNEAEQIIDVSRRTGVPVIVGTMHQFDEVLRAIDETWDSLPERSFFTQSTIFAQANLAVASLVTEIESGSPAGSPPDGPAAEPSILDLLPIMLLGVEIHHIGLLRRTVPDVEAISVLDVRPTRYQITVHGQGRAAQMTGYFHRHSRLEWSYKIWAADAHARVAYPQSFLHGRSARAQLWTDGETVGREVAFGDTWESGYRAEWRHLYDIAMGRAEPYVSLDSAIDDLRWVDRVVDVAREQLT